MTFVDSIDYLVADLAKRSPDPLSTDQWTLPNAEQPRGPI
jgi:hypothetical protein